MGEGNYVGVGRAVITSLNFVSSRRKSIYTGKIFRNNL
jgi:hypothetical protein